MNNSNSCTILEAWNLYRETKIITELNQKKELSLFNLHVLSYWGDIDLSQIRTRDIISYRNSLMQHLSPKSTKNCLSLLRSLYNRAKKYEIYDGNIPYFEMPRVNNERIRYLNEEEAKLLLEALYAKSILWHDITLFALNTGLRANEIFSLTSNAINLPQKILIVFEAKNGHTRVVPLNSTSYIIAEKYLKKKYAFLFSNNKINGVSKIFKKTIDELQFNKNCRDNRDRLVFHSLRHTFASWLVQSGVDIIIVKELLGHRCLQMTMRYAHLAPNQGRKAVHEIVHIIKETD